MLRTIDSVADPMPLVRALDELPAEQVAIAAGRLTAGSTGRELAELTAKHGSQVLRAEIKHPGLAGKFVRHLGDDGAELATKLSSGEASAVAKHVDDIGRLDPPLRNRLLVAIGQQPKRFAEAMGRFVKDNPGKVLFTAAATTAILANPDPFLGTVLPDGSIAPGLIDRTIDKTVTPVIRTLMWIVIPTLAIGAAILLLWFYNATKPKLSLPESELVGDESSRD